VKQSVGGLVAFTLVLVVVGACGSDVSGSTAAKSDGFNEKTSQTEPLVGTWERVTKCAELAQALKKVGLKKLIPDFVVGNSFLPGIKSADQLVDRSDPCKGSVPRKHSHFFTEDGEFGSLDWKGEQVDDGTYRIIDDNTFVVSKEFPDVTFNYEIQGDTITFDPVIPDCLAGCFEAGWSVAVAYPGKAWNRVD
jgi:hypothetical protein